MINLLSSQGEVYLYPDFFNKEKSDYFLKNLLDEIQWKQEPIRIFGKMVMQPRLTALYGDSDKPYRYSRQYQYKTFPWEPIADAGRYTGILGASAAQNQHTSAPEN